MIFFFKNVLFNDSSHHLFLVVYYFISLIIFSIVMLVSKLTKKINMTRILLLLLSLCLVGSKLVIKSAFVLGLFEG